MSKWTVVMRVCFFKYCRMKYYIVDAFTNQPFGGNPAGVVLLDLDSFPTEELMLQIAAELRCSETAFVKRHSAQEFTAIAAPQCSRNALGD